MAHLNRTEVIGRLTHDPEAIGKEKQGCNLRIAVNEPYTQNGEKKERTTYYRFSCWNGLAKQCAQYLKKGRSVFVRARGENNTITNEDGSTRTIFNLVAQDVQFLDNAPKSAE